MKIRIRIILVIILLPFHGIVQELEPVHWQANVKTKSDAIFEIHLAAVIDPFWHIYSMHSPEEISFPTNFHFNSNPLVEFQGPLKESGELTEKAEQGIKLKYYSHFVEYVQLIKLKAPVKTNFTGAVTYMACTEERCLPPKVFVFALKLK